MLIAIIGTGGAVYYLLFGLCCARAHDPPHAARGRQRTRGKPTVERRVAAGMKSGVSRLAAQLGGLMPLKDADREKIAVGLRRAAFRSDSALSSRAWRQVRLPAGGTGRWDRGVAPELARGVGLGDWPAGWSLFAGVLLNLLPEFVVSRIATVRYRRVHNGLADAFDLLIVCLESGLTFDRALRRTIENLQSFQPDLAKELGQASLDMSVHGRTREEALSRLASRLDSQDFRDLAVTVAQSERHGTPLADAMRKLARFASAYRRSRACRRRWGGCRPF